ncbi:hypothetical protein CPC08DRAFT_815693 [Agrocybe pediades]|nr:hypothetical protein CPC08DRAFT_815693 [Agrocybe pediades]
MYVSVQHVSFKSEIFGWLTKISIRMTDIMRLEKANTAIIIPNAILIATAERDYFFASFLFRDSAFETIEKIWAMSRPQIDKALSMTDGKDLDSYDDSYDDGVFRRHVSEPFRAIETALPAVNDARSAEKAFAGETRQYEISTT